jgi:lysophospholipase L1-like esterase
MMNWKLLMNNLLKTKPAILVFSASMVCLTVFALSSHKETPVKESLQPEAVLTDTVSSRISFVIDSLCYISDSAASLDAFSDELMSLLAGKDTVVKILHIGDSHVQAGFLTGQVMRMLQETFGNAGRGWIAPLKLARSNEPVDYFIQSPGIKNWTVGRCVQRAPECPWGPGGIALQTASGTVDFKIRISPNSGAGYEFNEVHLFRDENTLPMLPVKADSLPVETAWGSKANDNHVIVDTFRIADIIDSIHLQTACKEDLSEEDMNLPGTANRYYGFSLMNGNSGILYHSVGNNGATFTNYIHRDFMRQLSLFEPSLLIVSLGTNEAFGRNFRTEDFESQMDEFIRLIKEYLPHTAILLTTPAESYRRIRKKGYQRNVNYAQVANTIAAYARKEGLACFNLYEMTGGANSCQKWQQASFYRRDRIHFTIEGYQEQGKLLYKALLRLQMNKQTLASGGDF